jgi:hypothetical protein
MLSFLNLGESKDFMNLGESKDFKFDQIYIIR